ncbi:proteasome maturation factor UMP1-domain-containing protein [Peziza echinospora]|nr:proteasome maturation factor UMP1-domain-containing protein [Peziza echinospora]
MSALRLAPPSAQPTSISHTPLDGSSKNAPSAPTAVHDTLRHGLSNTSTALNSSHPLENRLKNWDAQQEKLKMEGLRRVFGLAEPLRRGMEMRIVGADWRPKVLGYGAGGDLHLDILRGRDESCEWEDVFTDTLTETTISFHDEMEQKLNMKW